MSILATTDVTYSESLDENTIKNQNISKIEKDGLSLTIKTDQIKYFTDQPVDISWTVENIGSESVSYTKRSTCSTGFDFEILDERGNIIDLVSSDVLFIPQNDPRTIKFDSLQFYGHILNSIENKDMAQDESLMILSSDPDKLSQLLVNSHHVKEYNVSDRFQLVSAQVNVNEIPKIADYDIVSKINNGGRNICGLAESEEQLEPQQIIQGNYSWGQKVLEKDGKSIPDILRVPEGDYTIKIQFGNISNILKIQLISNNDLISKSVENLKKYDKSAQNLTSSHIEENNPGPKLVSPEELMMDKTLEPLRNNVKLLILSENATQINHSIFSKELLSTIKQLEQDKIIKIENLPKYENESLYNSLNPIIPEWSIKNTVSWWGEKKISDLDFIHFIEYFANFSMD